MHDYTAAVYKKGKCVKRYITPHSKPTDQGLVVEAKLAWHLASGKLAAIVVNTPRATKGERGTGVGPTSLAATRLAAVEERQASCQPTDGGR